VHNGLSETLCLVATFPQLEPARDAWPPGHVVVGPLLWEPPSGEVAGPPPGDGPVVLVAPSTSQDPGRRLLRCALEGLAGERARVVAVWNGRRPDPGPPVPGNAVLVPWLSYARTMPTCDLVVTHGGHGTVARALSLGVPVVVAPAAGDMAETAARVDWAGVGVRLPWRLVAPWSVRLAVRRALAEPALAARARELAAWTRARPGPERAAEVVEAWARAGAAGAPLPRGVVGA
jgi:UDP:flavonoid glycosyltransferase YjiC (YdhE family)